jgi:hypothetical protein
MDEHGSTQILIKTVHPRLSRASAENAECAEKKIKIIPTKHTKYSKSYQKK